MEATKVKGNDASLQLRFAVYYKQLGFNIFPCGLNKKPLIPEVKPYHETPATLEQVEQWWSKDHKGANIGWLMGQDFVALDADRKEAVEHLIKLKRRGNVVNYTPKGAHLIFKTNPNFEVKNSAVPKCWDELDDEGKANHVKEDYIADNPPHLKIDVRGRGGYIILAPSRNEKGEYRLDNPQFSPEELPEITIQDLEYIGHERDKKVRWKNKGSGFDARAFKEKYKDWLKPELKRVIERQDLESLMSKVASHCRKVNWLHGRKFTACCPAHDDKNPSFFAELSEHNGEEKVVLHCSSGCTHESILNVLGLEYRDLFRTHESYVQEFQENTPNIIPPEVEEKAKQTAKRLMNYRALGEFDYSFLPPIFKDYIRDVQSVTNASPIITVMGLLVSFSSYGKHKIKMPDYFSELHVNLWCLTLSKSGQHKSTALEKGCLKLKRDESERMRTISKKKKEIKEFQVHEQPPEAIQSLEQEIEFLKEQKLQLAPTGSWQGLIDDLKVCGGGALILSEFSSWYQEMMKKHNDGLKTKFTEIYDVIYPVIEQTRSNENYIENPFISIASVSTLEFLKEAVRNIEVDVKSGFFSRFLFFYPPSEFEVPPSFPLNQKPLHERDSYKRLESLFEVIRDTEERHFTVNSIEKEAREFYEEKYQKIYEDFRSYSEESQSWLAGFLKRWPPTMLKMSMLFQMAFNVRSNQIGIDAMRASWSVLEYAIQSTKMIFETDIGLSPYQQTLEKFLGYVAKNKGRITWSQMIQSSPFQNFKKFERDDMLQTLVESGQIKIIKSKSGGKEIYLN